MAFIKATEGITEILVILIVSVIFIIVTALYTWRIKPFFKTRSFIKKKIEYWDNDYSCFWKNELKKLYISQIPVLGRIILRFKE